MPPLHALRPAPRAPSLLLLGLLSGCGWALKAEDGNASASTGTSDSDSDTGTSDTVADPTEDPPACDLDGICDPGEAAMTCMDCINCGDGKVNEGETCDDGNDDDSDDCVRCNPAACGDGAVQAGKETCDDGEQNSADWSADQRCNLDCQSYAPYCGDGTCQAEHEDAGACPDDGCAAICGNGKKEGAEACDDGNQDDTDACLPTCEAASCGDGLVRAGVEDCDDANSENTDACLNTCKTPACGDGFVQDGIEACEDKNDVNDDACSNDCQLPRRIFVTSTLHEGNLGGLAGADLACQDRADATQLGGTFLAWLSDDIDSPSTRLDTSFTGAYKLVDGSVIVSAGWADLTDGTLAHAINLDEKGVQPLSKYVWSNTTSKGEKVGADSCKGWSSAQLADDGHLGNSSAADTLWTDEGANGCSGSYRLYCVEK